MGFRGRGRKGLCGEERVGEGVIRTGKRGGGGKRDGRRICFRLMGFVILMYM